MNAQGGREARIRAFAAEHRARLAAERTGIDAPVLHGLGSSDAAEAEGEGGEELASPVASPMAAGRAAAPSPLPGERGTCRQIGMLLCSPLYVLLTLALCFLYFVVTGIQFWITDYLHEVVGEPKEKVLTAFAITSCTGPALGVVFGGWLVDRMGGYKDESASVELGRHFQVLVGGWRPGVRLLGRGWSRFGWSGYWWLGRRWQGQRAGRLVVDF